MSKDTARQEVEKVCFAYEKAGKTGNKKDWGKFYDLEEELIKKVEVANQPKLSIPKKIAEELDGFNPNECETKIELLIVGYYKSFLSDELMSFCLANNGLNLCAFYLAGKALGVELVEVEG